MTHVVYVIVNHDTNQAYAGLTKQFSRRLADHQRSKPRLFAGNHTVMKTEPMTGAAAQQAEAKAIQYLKSIGYRVVNATKAGSLGQPLTLIWSKERCAEEALKYQERYEFHRNARGAYATAHRNGWLGDICGHMISRHNSSDHWTKERCVEEASKYQTRKEFKRKATSAYQVSQRNGWLDELCAHMTRLRKPDGHWTKQRCAEEALKYQKRSEFERESRGTYDTSRRNGWLDDLCTHMKGRPQ